MNEAPEIEKDHGQRRRFWMWFLVCAFLLIGVVVLLYWIFIGRFHVFTNDAYVNGNTIVLTPQVSSGVVAIYADEPDLVQEGQVVVQLDTTEFEITYQWKKAGLAETVRQVAQFFEAVKEAESTVLLRKAELYQRELDLEYRVGLIDPGAISLQEFEQAKTDVAVAKASLSLAEEQLISAQLMVQNTTVETHPLVREAISELRTAFLNLIRCQLWAPVTGYVVKRTVQVGQQVLVGEILLTIVPLNDLWLEANYKETQIRNIRIGQPVEFTADMYGRGIKFHGKVLGFAAGTGNAFALLPPENASGNWIKIIQRLPIRVSIDPQELRNFPLMIGLSLRVRTHVHDTTGRRLSCVPSQCALFSTSIYDQQDEDLEDLDSLIQETIKFNKGFFEE